MGHDATVYIRKGHTLKDVEKQLTMLGYEKNRHGFYKGNFDNYDYMYGVSARINKSKIEDIAFEVCVRTSFACNQYDLKAQNQTLRHLKKYFQSYFISDVGKNRYFTLDDNEDLVGAENGCYLAIDSLENQFNYLSLALSKISEDNDAEKVMRKIQMPSPSVFNANVYLSFLCSLLEQYFKETYIVLLNYSDRREEIIKAGHKISSYEICDISRGILTVDRAFANGLSFQNINKICQNFKTLDKNLDLNSLLKKPHKRKKENDFEMLNRIFEQRHAMIHRIEYDLSYDNIFFEKDIKNVKRIISNVYKFICDKHKWDPQETVL